MPALEKPADKQKESLLAMKNANSHLNDIFKKIAETDAIVSNVINELRGIAAQVGKIKVEAYGEGKWQAVSLENLLNVLVNKLNTVRS